MVGRIFITSTGYDPEHGKHVKDPYLGPRSSLGACRPDVRKRAKPGDYIFTISGRVPGRQQYIFGGFRVSEVINAHVAYLRFPDQRLRQLPNGELTGNVIVDESGRRHPLDQHPLKGFEGRTQHYLVGDPAIAVLDPAETERARAETMDLLRTVFRKDGAKPFDIIGRSAPILDANQVRTILRWLIAVKLRVPFDRKVA